MNGARPLPDATTPSNVTRMGWSKEEERKKRDRRIKERQAATDETSDKISKVKDSTKN